MSTIYHNFHASRVSSSNSGARYLKVKRNQEFGEHLLVCQVKGWLSNEERYNCFAIVSWQSMLISCFCFFFFLFSFF